MPVCGYEKKNGFFLAFSNWESVQASLTRF